MTAVSAHGCPPRLLRTIESFAAETLTGSESVSLVDEACSRSTAFAPGAGDSDAAAGLRARMLVADVVSRLSADRAWSPQEIGAVIQKLADATGVPLDVTKADIFVRAIRDPRLFEYAPAKAVETALRLLFCFAPVSAVSLWRGEALEPIQCAAWVGGNGPTRRMRASAAAALGTKENSDWSNSGSIHSVPVLHGQQTCAALVLRVHSKDRAAALALAREAARTLGRVLEREALLRQGTERERSLVESSERRLARLSFDLHDGPLQDVGTAVRELHLFRDDLRRLIPEKEGQDLLLRRLDYLEEVLFSSETELRELTQSVDSPSILRRPFSETVEREVNAASSSIGAEVRLDLRGDFESLTASQRIALLRIIQEALANVKDHSGADEIDVSVIQSSDRVEAKIVDNGCGFQVERTILRAVRKGRLGLVGMSERARLLGGTLDVTSRPGLTTVFVVLPVWQPAVVDEGLQVPA